MKMEKNYEELVNYEKGIAGDGNVSRLKALFERAKKGEKIKVGFLGGSITQGSLSSTPETCYAALVTRWWRETFKEADIEYINAGIGGTTSQFGVARAEEDLLCKQPDFVIIEFSVNDDNNIFFREAYEGLVRKVYGAPFKPAVICLHNVCYDTGTNAQDQHEIIGEYYDIPCLSMKTSVYRALATGLIKNREITPDDLHPNDAGHELLSKLVIKYLEGVLSGKYGHECAEEKALKTPITENAYEDSKRYRNDSKVYILDGFLCDSEPQNNITETFRKGFIGKKKGDRISFKVSGSGLAIQYRKSVKHPACIAKVTVDKEKATVLDGNFDETWGDCLYITTVLVHGEDKEHLVEIEVTDGDESFVPFYLVSVIASR